MSRSSRVGIKKKELVLQGRGEGERFGEFWFRGTSDRAISERGSVKG